MKGGGKLFIFAGVGLALVAIALLVSSLQGGGKTTADEQKSAPKVTIVEAVEPLSAHALITVDLLREREVPANEAPADAIASVTEAAGMAYRVPLAIGQPLLRSQLETPGLRNDIAAGKRAIALPVDETSSMSGLVQDGDYVDIIFHARLDIVRVLPSEQADVIEQGIFELKKPVLVPFGEQEDVENYPLPGEDGSTFVIRDDVGDAAELEAVAKIILQDIHVLRVIRPGDKFLPDGTRAQSTTAEGAEPGQEATIGQIVLEVTPEQAELITFIQDRHHKYQVIVRAKDDHQVANTSGITFDTLASDAEWGMPWPKSVTTDEDGVVVSERGLQATPVAADGAETAADADAADEEEPAAESDDAADE